MTIQRKDKPLTQKDLHKEFGVFTEEVLSPMLDERFGAVDTKFEKMDAKFERLEHRMDGKLERLENRMTDKLHELLAALEHRMTGQFHELFTYAEKIMSKLNAKEEEQLMHDHLHKTTADELVHHERRIVILEKSVKK